MSLHRDHDTTTDHFVNAVHGERREEDRADRATVIIDALLAAWAGVGNQDEAIHRALSFRIDPYRAHDEAKASAAEALAYIAAKQAELAVPS